ncbi:MAG: MFS transporter [Geminicoccaceae bacterium]|jgi:predicted MFS family arabinose efflux permease|nr:MFS transporter [Geminicoccaceae bacterium]MCB9968805.1 MFS transporter [Geminicoccaceae bacterium]HRY26144.1 MFS transporter [Geminicoccaceae bacterium]
MTAAGDATDGPPHGQAILLLSLAGFFSIALLRSCDPLVPEIARSFDASIAEASAPVIAYAVAYGMGQLLFGPVGSRLGTFRTASIGCTFAALFSLLCAFVASLDQLVAARTLAGFAAGGIVPMSIAFIGETVPYSQRQTTLARLMTGAILGSIAGFAVSGMLAHYMDWRYIFALLSLGLAAVTGGLWLHLPRLARQAAQRSGFLVNPLRQYARILRLRWPRVVLVAVAIEGAVFGVVPFIGVLLAREHGLGNLGIGAVLGCLGLGSLTFAVLAGRIIARLGEFGCARIGGAVALGGFALVAISPAPLLVGVGAYAAGLGYMMLHNTLQANATQMVPEDRSGAVSLFAFCLFTGQASGVALFAAITPLVGFRPAIMASGVVVLAVGLAFAAAKQRMVAAAEG